MKGAVPFFTERHILAVEEKVVMLTATETVLEQFDQAIANASDADREEKFLRIVRSENAGGLSLALQQPAPDDTTFEYEGRTDAAGGATRKAASPWRSGDRMFKRRLSLSLSVPRM